ATEPTAGSNPCSPGVRRPRRNAPAAARYCSAEKSRGQCSIEDLLVVSPLQAVLADVDRVVPCCTQARGERGSQIVVDQTSSGLAKRKLALLARSPTEAIA